MGACKKCHKEMPDGALFCPWCGVRQGSVKRRTHRPNGFGSIYKRGSTWTAKVRRWGSDGELVSKTAGGFLTKREAELAIPRLQEELAVGSSLRSSTTFAQLYEKWVPFYADRVSDGEMNSARAAFAHFAPIHGVKFTDVTTSQMQSCMNACGRGKRTKENMKLLARRLYAYAIGERLASVDYSAPLFTGREEKGTRPAFTPDEVKLIDQAERDGVPYAAYVLTMIYTGYRPTELLSLTAESYDPETNMLKAGIKTEAGKGRLMPVHPRIAPIIRERVAAGGFLFPCPDGSQMSEETFRNRCFRPLMDGLGITGRVPYSARHTFANLLKDVPGSDKDKAALMGHSDHAQTKYYQSVDQKSLVEIIAGVNTVSTGK